MFLMEGHRAVPICAPFEIFADEIGTFLKSLLQHLRSLHKNLESMEPHKHRASAPYL